MRRCVGDEGGRSGKRRELKGYCNYPSREEQQQAAAPQQAAACRPSVRARRELLGVVHPLSLCSGARGVLAKSYFGSIDIIAIAVCGWERGQGQGQTYVRPLATRGFDDPMTIIALASICNPR